MQRRFLLAMTFSLLAGWGWAAAAYAVPTQIEVRVISKGGKFVGTSMGGVQVTLTDADTGELLAKGVTQGTTGNTDIIMKDAHVRGEPVATDDAAVFAAEIDIDEPLRLSVEAFGPLTQRQAAVSASSTQWVVPGKHITGGDGWLLELPGLVVDVLDPPANVKLGEGPQVISLRANVTIMCGCPITPGGLWDADTFEVVALVKRDGEPVARVPLAYAGSPSQFAAEYTADESGSYEAIVYAYQASNGNTGVDRTTWILP